MHFFSNKHIIPWYIAPPLFKKMLLCKEVILFWWSKILKQIVWCLSNSIIYFFFKAQRNSIHCDTFNSLLLQTAKPVRTDKSSSSVNISVTTCCDSLAVSLLLTVMLRLSPLLILDSVTVDVSYIYTHALRSVLCIVVNFICIEFVSLHCQFLLWWIFACCTSHWTFILIDLWCSEIIPTHIHIRRACMPVYEPSCFILKCDVERLFLHTYICVGPVCLYMSLRALFWLVM
jgi:hypothetical protein